MMLKLYVAGLRLDNRSVVAMAVGKVLRVVKDAIFLNRRMPLIKVGRLPGCENKRAWRLPSTDLERHS